VVGFRPFRWRRDGDGRSTMQAKPFDPSGLLRYCRCDARLFHVGNGNGVLWLLWMAEGLGMSSIGSHEAEITVSRDCAYVVGLNQIGPSRETHSEVR
jgi:hypothetical protein